jgi:tetratricopeptide (TPR) repeat protein
LGNVARCFLATLEVVATDVSPLAAARNRRVVVLVAIAAAIAAVAVVGVTLLQTRGEHTTVPGAVTKPRSGRPPLELDFGVDGSAEAQALRQAQALYDRGDVAAAAPIFARYKSLEARLGAAFAAWRGPSSLEAVKKLAAAYPEDPAALLQLGLADYWAGRNADAVAAWEETAKAGADSPYGVEAEDLLHPNLRIPGLPPIVTGLALPPRIAKLPPARQLAELKRAAAKPEARAKLLYGSALWTLKRPVSAEREFAAAARLAPHDSVARAAAAVALFSKAKPVRAFARLGPLTAVFPHSAAVQFHLGVLLLYIGENAKAARHLRAAVADEPQSPYAKDARPLLASLANTRSK